MICMYVRRTVVKLTGSGTERRLCRNQNNILVLYYTCLINSIWATSKCTYSKPIEASGYRGGAAVIIMIDG